MENGSSFLYSLRLVRHRLCQMCTRYGHELLEIDDVMAELDSIIRLIDRMDPENWGEYEDGSVRPAGTAIPLE